MHRNMQRYYARNKFFLSQVGGWPYQPKLLKVLLPCLLMVVEVSLFIAEILLLHDTWGDINMAVEAIVNIILLTGASTKLINIAVNNSQFQQVLQLMDHHWRLFDSQLELHTLKYYARIGHKVTKYYAVNIYTFMVIFMTVPLIPRILDIVMPLNESRPITVVVEAEYRVDKEKYFYPILLHSYLAVMVSVGAMVNVDTMYIVCVLHGCSLFSAIGASLENIMSEADALLYNDEESRSHKHLTKPHDVKCDVDYREMMVCLKKHQLALEYIQALDSTFTHATFVLLFLNVMIMSLIGIQLINKLGRTEEVIRFAFIAVGSVSHLFCLCFPGQLLIDHSAEVFDRAYSSRWYAFSSKTKNLLKILLYRSLVPCTLSAGKMYVMSMTMCSSVVQTAMSYFTAFLSVR